MGAVKKRGDQKQDKASYFMVPEGSLTPMPPMGTGILSYSEKERQVY